MIPGITTKLSQSTVASAATIHAKSDTVLVTGTTTINTIMPYFGAGFGGMIILIPTDGAVTLGTSGNILVGITMAVNRAVTLVYVKSTSKWYIESGV